LTDDVPIYALRFFSKAPMVGYKSPDCLFYVIWFDCEIKRYDH